MGITLYIFCIESIDLILLSWQNLSTYHIKINKLDIYLIIFLVVDKSAKLLKSQIKHNICTLNVRPNVEAE